MRYEQQDIAILVAELRRFSEAVIGGPHDRAAEVLLDLYDEVDRRGKLIDECRRMYLFKSRENDRFRRLLNLKSLPLVRNTVDADTDKLIALHNAARAKGGFFRRNAQAEPLQRDEKLMTYAQGHANWMAEKGRLKHSNMSDIMKLGFSTAGENIAYGQLTPEEVMTTWLWSFGHRRNILSRSYDRIGCGARKDDRGRMYWCVCFGKA